MEHTRKLHTWGGFLLLLVLLVTFLIWNLLAGSVRLPASEIWAILHGGGDLTQRRILLNIRLPRLLAAMILGGALSVSGFLLQTFFHNPIAGPFVLGISSGAKFTVAVTMILLLSRGVTSSSAALIAAAFVGAMLSMGFVLLISRRVRRMSLLVVCGVMIGYICSALTDFLVTFADDSNIVNLHNWSLGSFSGMSWDNVSLTQRLWFARALKAVGAKAGWGIVILSHYPLDFTENLDKNSSAKTLGNILKQYVDGGSVTLSGMTVSFKDSNSAKIYAAFHGHTHNFAVAKLSDVQDSGNTEFDVLRIATPNMCYFYNNELGANECYSMHSIQTVQILPH